MKIPNHRKCKICKTRFKPATLYEWWCSEEHKEDLIKVLAEKARHKRIQEQEKRRKIKVKEEKDDLKARREKLKTKSDWNREAQAAVNKFIYWRDYGKTCIACGRKLNYGVRGGSVDSSHYRSRGSASHLCFNIYNIHSGCVYCNRDLSGNIIPYRINLIKRIGIDRVEKLEHDNTPRKFTIEYLQRVKAIFTRRASHYEKLRKRTIGEAA